MQDASPQITAAGDREAGAVCVHCGAALQLGDATAICRVCGSVHHQSCWNASGGCRSYQCSAANSPGGGGEVLSVSREELASAVPLPPPAPSTESLLDEARQRPKRWNRTAIWAVAVALLGIPLFGLVTGLVAIVLGCIALVVHTQNRKGLSLAVAAVLLGLFDVIGWTVGLAMYFGDFTAPVALQELALDPEALDELPADIARAMRANVLISVDAGFGQQGIGSGVVLQVKDGAAQIVTNRHVVDHNYKGGAKPPPPPPDLDDLGDVQVMTVGQAVAPASVEWIAPHGVDLAIISAPVADVDVQEAFWNDGARPRIGERVFAVGNPHGLGWTHSEGTVSQVRTRLRGAYKFKVLQSTAAINPGNSGGGLYDARGKLIGINTLTGDKRFAEGLGFSISFNTLLELAPDWLGVPAEHHPGEEDRP